MPGCSNVIHTIPWAALCARGLLCHSRLSVSMPPPVSPSPPSPSSAVPTILLSASVSLLLFSFCIYFLCSLPHGNEITGCLSFSEWLMSLSLIPSRSFHVVTEGMTSCLLRPSSILLHICSASSSSARVPMGTRLASVARRWRMFAATDIEVQRPSPVRVWGFFG